jgi:isovaleryl-CoA dehydrogenase
VILPEDHYMLLESIRKFAKKEVAPFAEQIDEEDRFPIDAFRKLGELGFLGVTIPEDYGGVGSDALAQVIVLEELARVCPALSQSVGAHSNLCTQNIFWNGNEAQRQKYVPPLCSGSHIGALAITEPDFGSDAFGIQTSARKDGDIYVLNGTKMFITNGPIADTILLYAKTDKSKGPRGITAFVVEKGYKGFAVSRELRKMGMRGSPTGELILEDCIVPKDGVLRSENEGLEVMYSGLDIERIVMGGMTLGIAQGAFDLALEYSKVRVQFGKPISSFQLVKAKLADMYTNIEAARTFLYDAAIRAESAKSYTIEAAAAYLFVSETATRVVLDAVQIHGGYSYMLEYPINRFYRDVKITEIGGGTTEIRKLIIARELLRR